MRMNSHIFFLCNTVIHTEQFFLFPSYPGTCTLTQPAVCSFRPELLFGQLQHKSLSAMLWPGSICKRTQNAWEGWNAVLKSCVSFPTIPNFTANWHLAGRLSCLHNPLTPAVMQLITIKHKKEVCKGRNTCPFPVLHIGCLLSQTNSIGSSSPCTALKFNLDLPTAPDTGHLFSVPWLNFEHQLSAERQIPPIHFDSDIQ